VNTRAVAGQCSRPTVSRPSSLPSTTCRPPGRARPNRRPSAGGEVGVPAAGVSRGHGPVNPAWLITGLSLDLVPQQRGASDHGPSSERDEERAVAGELLVVH
jgi:hypothetical protein